jgi:hypothetical protein
MMLHAKQMISMQLLLKQMDQNIKAVGIIKKKSLDTIQTSHTAINPFFFFAGVKDDNKKAKDPPLT